MASPATSPPADPARGEVTKYIAAFGAVYLIWGSTYLAIRVVVETMPPLLAAGIRFFLSGALLYGWARLRGAPAPHRAEWKSLLILGALMFCVCYGCLFGAEQTLPSGLASVLTATLPLWTLILEILFLGTERLNVALCVSLLLGFAGVGIISAASAGSVGHAAFVPVLLILVGDLAWAAGSILSKRLALPTTQSVSAGAQMLSGGLMLLCLSFAFGEWKHASLPPPRALAGLAWLILAGSIAAFSAFVWLLRRMGPTRVSSYAYVNPVIALALGYFLGGERFGTGAILGSLLVLASVVLILNQRQPARAR